MAQKRRSGISFLSSPRDGRDPEKLEAARLIDHRQRDGRKSNTYFFLFHASFEQTRTSYQTVYAAAARPVIYVP